MNCPNCSNPIPDDKLACPSCVQRRSWQAYLDQQKKLLPVLLEGRYPLSVRATRVQAERHIALLGDPYHAWCGRPVSPRMRWKPEEVSENFFDSICPECRKVFDKLVAELADEIELA